MPSDNVPATGEIVLSRLQRRLPHLARLIQPEVRLDQAALDSLDWVELLCVVDSEFHVRLNDEEVRGAQTVAALGQLIAARSNKGGAP